MNYDSKHTEIIAPQEGYDLVAKQYKDYHKHLDTFYHINFLKFLPRKSEFSIIDLGAGDGRMYKELSIIPHSTYVACDISREMLLNHPKGPQHLVANLEEKLPLDDESFDIAVCFFTLEHIEKSEEFLAECYRILKDGGKLFIGHFFQRREFKRSAKNRNFKIKQYKRETADIVEEATFAGFTTEVLPLYDKADYNGDLIICEK
ncbi:MAG: class I SAM-dependent methyltransferase [Candidatus Absconditabacteria bacterium]|nr:class I SAM-dependent methyltransferase [Candidatus Absconditabacteria bacterium]MDD3868601.1 class I SAM-dependent methyltransferase [Candidatus Absconditabacteria bacterium]MDD4714730.1 class I SAM-dependent methyltransferase [Candidatus Absconditabacteria bacterium]